MFAGGRLTVCRARARGSFRLRIEIAAAMVPVARPILHVFFLTALVALSAGVFAPVQRLAAAQATVVASPAPAASPVPADKIETIRLKNGSDIIGEVVAQDAAMLVVFNGAGNLAIARDQVVWRHKGGALEADSSTPAVLEHNVVAKPVSDALLVEARAAPTESLGSPISPDSAVGARPRRGEGTLNEVLAEPESYLDTLAERVSGAGPGPVLIELESIYRFRPVNRQVAYEHLGADEAEAVRLTRPILSMTKQALTAELTTSPYSNEETFGNGLIGRLTLPDIRQLVALRRILHAFNTEKTYTYAVNATFTDLLDLRRPMGDCNSSAALVDQLMIASGYGRGLELFEDVAGHHAVLMTTCTEDSRHYFGETTGGFLSGNPRYQHMAEDPATYLTTPVASLMDEGYPPGLSDLQNLRLALIVRLTSPDECSHDNFKHYFVVYINDCLEAHDTASVQGWAAIYDRVEGAGAYEALPRSTVATAGAK